MGYPGYPGQDFPTLVASASAPPPPPFNPHISPQPYPSFAVPVSLSGDSQRMNCPFCRADITTSIKYRNGRLNHIAAIVLCLTGTCCCCIPYLMDACKDVEHSCPNCERHIGNFRR